MDYDVAVIGAGHAGIEAALASARLGCKVIIFTKNMDFVGNCPCNPAIGGTAKGHLVKEIDALGGEMGKTTDETSIHSRMLNRSKGPAVQSLRAQIDRAEYKNLMKFKLESNENILLRQAEIVAVEKLSNEGYLLKTMLGVSFCSKAVIIAAGTFLDSKIFVGEKTFSAGPDGSFSTSLLSDSIKKLGIKLNRFKTGTSARVLSRSVDYSTLELQEGDEPVVAFSAETKTQIHNKKPCYLTWTNDKTKEVVLKNIDRTAKYSGRAFGEGPRYCPSIEDKITRFPDKERHLVFLEPCGLKTEEVYLQGVSTSLPEEVQEELYSTIEGLKDVKIVRTGYAIEYDCIDPTQLNLTLEFKEHKGLFGAGQFNGTSGYEEAAAQGMVAGINAAMYVFKKEKIVFSRQESYIGTLIDDLVTKGVKDPYRMMTSRSEYRLILRQDNAEERMTPIGRKIGLIPQQRWEDFVARQSLKNDEIKRVEKLVLQPSTTLNEILVSRGTTQITTPTKMAELLKRPQIDYEVLKEVDPERKELPPLIKLQVETEIKYEGYIQKQKKKVEEVLKQENKKIPQDFDYKEIKGIRLEAKEKLEKIRPQNIGQASRISGVNPADIAVLIVYLSKTNRCKND